ncbi:MAG: DUF86 domain-containing protein [Candidatus Lokiarchaeota archaeon]|nr:DUF86 domain-containing protein [Candidatus Lokiarchaeota archaeon]
MEKKRIKRYKEKLEQIEEFLNYLKDWTKDINKNDFIYKLNIREQLSIYHAYQIIIEAISDLAAMIIKDLNLIPKDDYTNINLLVKKQIISKEISLVIKEATGLRNKIVHKYNRLVDEIAYKGILSHINGLEKYKEVVKKWYQKNF